MNKSLEHDEKNKTEKSKTSQEREVGLGDSWKIGSSELRWTKILLARQNGGV